MLHNFQSGGGGWQCSSFIQPLWITTIKVFYIFTVTESDTPPPKPSQKKHLGKGKKERLTFHSYLVIFRVILVIFSAIIKPVLSQDFSFFNRFLKVYRYISILRMENTCGFLHCWESVIFRYYEWKILAVFLHCWESVIFRYYELKILAVFLKLLKLVSFRYYIIKPIQINIYRNDTS